MNSDDNKPAKSNRAAENGKGTKSPSTSSTSSTSSRKKSWKRLTQITRPTLGKQNGPSTSSHEQVGGNSPPYKADNPYLKSFTYPEPIATKSDEDILRTKRSTQDGVSGSTFATSTSYLISLTTCTNSKSKVERIGSGNGCQTNEKADSGGKKNSKEKSESSPVLQYQVYLGKGGKYLPSLDYGLEITFSLCSLAKNDSFADFFSSHFVKLFQSKADAKSEHDKIEYSKSLVQHFLTTSQQISSRSKKLLKRSKSKLQPSSSRKKMVHSDSSAKILKSNSASKIFKTPDSTCSRKSVESVTTMSSTKSNDSLKSNGKFVKSPSVMTPTEVMVRGYVFHRLVSGGSFSTLYLCTSFNMPGRELACKHIRTTEFVGSKACLKDFIGQEIEVMQRVEHPNIIEMYEIVSNPTDVYIFMKFANKGTIFGMAPIDWTMGE